MKTILVPIDFSDVTTRVIETARIMASALGGKLVLLHVSEPEPDFVGFEPGPMAVRTTVVRDFRKERQRLEELRSQVSTAGLDVLALHIQGPLVDKVLDQAEEHHADLIVMGSHGHGALYEFLVGSVTNGVLRSAKCPVMVVPAHVEASADSKQAS
jgi:nucleotide-binding universal stress UspA family protein